MLAGQITQPGRVELIDVPEPTLEGPGEIVFQPEVACLCGSDLPFFRERQPSYPLEIGCSLHEMVGTVVATSGLRFRAGDRVLAVPLDQRGLLERFRVSETRAVPLDEDLPSREEAVFAQPLGTVLYALRRMPAVVGLDVAVVGQGPIGQLFCAALRSLGARRIVGVDVLESRLARSRRMGATHVICSARVEAAEAFRQMTGGVLADLVVEAVGHQDQAFHAAIDLCRHGGRILYFGVPPQTIDGLRWRDLFFKNITVHTSVQPEFDVDFPLAMRWIAEGRIDVVPLQTHRFSLGEIQTAYELFRDRQEGALKVLVDFPSGTEGIEGEIARPGSER